MTLFHLLLRLLGDIGVLVLMTITILVPVLLVGMIVLWLVLRIENRYIRRV